MENLKVCTQMTLAIEILPNGERKTCIVNDADVEEFKEKRNVEKIFTLPIYDGTSEVFFWSGKYEDIHAVGEAVANGIRKEIIDKFIDRLVSDTLFQEFVKRIRKMHYMGEQEMIIDALSSTYSVLSKRLEDLKRRGIDVTQTEMFSRNSFQERLDAAMRTGARRRGRKTG